MTLPTSYTNGQSGHLADHTTIAAQLVSLAAAVGTPGSYMAVDSVVMRPEDHGAIGDGTTDDTTALQTVFSAAAAAAHPVTVLLSKSYKTTRNLYVSGTTSIKGIGTAEIVFAANLAAVDGAAYWMVFGIPSKNGTPNRWSGDVEGVKFTAAATSGTQGRIINVIYARNFSFRRNSCDFTALATSNQVGWFGAFNDAGWSSQNSRSQLWIEDNYLVASQDNNHGSNAIGVASASQVWVRGNYCYGWGDDPIALGNVTDFEISGNHSYSTDGRFLMVSSRRGHVHDNHWERIANPDASWASGGSMMMTEIEVGTDYATCDIDIHDETIVHGSGIVSATYGIRLIGARRVRVHDIHVHETAGYGKAVTWEGFDGTGISWVDPEGVEVDAKARIRDLDIHDIQVTGGGLVEIKEILAFAGHVVGPVRVDGVPSLSVLSQIIAPAPPWPCYTSGLYVSAPTPGGVTTGTPTQSNNQAFPFIVGVGMSLDRIGVEVTATDPSSVVRLGIYYDNGHGYPGVLRLDAGTVDSHTATGFVEINIATTVLPPGVYWLSACSQGGAATLRCHLPYGSPYGSATALTVTGNALVGYQRSGQTGALPDPFGGSVSPVGSQMPRVVVRVV